MDNLLFIANYEAILRERKIKKGDFYAACSITDAAVSQWRKNKNHPAMKTINRIAEYLDVPVYSLIGEETKKEPATLASDKLPVEFYSLSESEQKQVKDYISFLLSQRSSD